MANEELERKILSQLFRSERLDAGLLATHIGYRLSADKESDDKFFNTLQRLEDRGLICWKPRSKESPGSNDSDPYTGKLYELS